MKRRFVHNLQGTVRTKVVSMLQEVASSLPPKAFATDFRVDISTSNILLICVEVRSLPRSVTYISRKVFFGAFGVNETKY